MGGNGRKSIEGADATGLLQPKSDRAGKEKLRRWLSFPEISAEIGTADWVNTGPKTLMGPGEDRSKLSGPDISARSAA